MQKWILQDNDTSTTGITRGMVMMHLKINSIPDSLQFTIYKLSTPFNYKEKLERVADFVLKRE